MARRSNLLFLLGLLIIFLLSYWLTLAGPPKKSMVNIEVAPVGAKITIDGKSAKVGKNKLSAGQHNVSAGMTGFATQSRQVETIDGQEAYAGFALQSSSGNTSGWYTQHPSDQKLAESISSHQTDYSTKVAVSKNTLLQQLPIVLGGAHGDIRIDSGKPINDGGVPAVYVTASSPGERQSALAWMRNNGYEPAAMDIVFYGASNGLGAADGE